MDLTPDPPKAIQLSKQHCITVSQKAPRLGGTTDKNGPEKAKTGIRCETNKSRPETATQTRGVGLVTNKSGPERTTKSLECNLLRFRVGRNGPRIRVGHQDPGV